MARTVVDTSVWVEFFRAKESAVGDLVEVLVEGRDAVCTGVILAELLSGARTRREFTEVLDVMLALDVLEDTLDVCTRAGEIAYSLRRRGITIPLADTLIAAQALINDMEVLTLDRHFSRVREALGLRLVET